MFKNVFQKVFGDSDSREVGRLQPVVDEINALGPEFAAMSDEDLRGQTAALREQITEQMQDLRDELGEARAAWQGESDDAERVQAQVNIERLERELRAAEAEALEAVLPRAFAAVREAATRTIGLRHYDVQLIGGIVLHEGKIAEMKTGEGKTLVATLPLYLNALLGQGCHLVTVNDYLARRDGGWMGRIFNLLGLSVGLVINSFSALYDPDYIVPGAGQEDERLVHWRPVARREAYLADITYGTNNEYGFDYLRDNIARDISLTVQRPLNYAIVDEVDNILVDEARTPLIISGPAEEATDQYRRFAELVRRLRPNTAGEDMPPNGHFNLDLKTKSVTLTEMGIAKIEEMVEEVNVEAGESIYDPQHYELTHYLDNAMRAQYAYHRDRDYVVQNGEVIIVDSNTGRLMPGRRYSEGLHEAIEAKENVVVQRETMTLATVTIQNYFRMYRKRAGMTGTAKTEEEEFRKIYNLDVVAIPTNVEYMAAQAHELTEVRIKQDSTPVTYYERKDRPGEPAYFKRVDYPDRIFGNWQAKYKAVVDEIRAMLEKGRPVLVGTISVESSELLSKELTRAGVKHTVLNAKLHEKEAHVIVQAGQPGVVTIATNMAGRGTDILLGGNAEGLAMHMVEERCFTVQDAAKLARLVVAGEVEQARHDAGGQAGLVDLMVRMNTEFEESLGWNSLPGGIPLQVSIHHLVPEFGVAQSVGRDLAALVQAGLTTSAEQRAEAMGLRPELIPWLTRFYSSLAQYATTGDKGEFLGRRVYEDHYKARAALVRLVLRGDTKEAEALVLSTPALPADLIPAIQRVKTKCEEDRQKIWQAGGLHIIGTERHEARRIDNQLRGRSARQGDPGSSQFFVSLDDDLMRRFGGERIQGILGRFGVGSDEDIELPPSGTLSKTIEGLQTKAESYNYDIRKHLLEFDNVVNKQREVIYSRRRNILEGERYDLEGEVRRLFVNILEQRIEQYTTGYEAWASGEIDEAISASSNPVTDEVNATAVLQRLSGIFGIERETMEDLADADAETLREELKAIAGEADEQGRPYTLLAIELHNLLLFLPPLPSVESIYGARNVVEARETARSGYLAQLTGLLDRLERALLERQVAVDKAVFEQQRQAAVEGVRKAFDVIGRERPSRDQLKQEQRTVERRLNEIGVQSVARCLAGVPVEQLSGMAEALFEEKLAEAYVQLGRGNYALLDTGEARAQDLKSLAELDAGVLRKDLAAIIGQAGAERLAEVVDDLCQDTADGDCAGWQEFGRSPNVAQLDDDRTTQLATALFDNLSAATRNMLAALSAERLGVQAMREFCQAEMLGAIDTFWPQYLTAMDELREGIGLQAFAQRDPLVEFSRQSFAGFERLLVEIDRQVIDHFFQDLPRWQAIVAQHRASLRMQEQLALSGARVEQSGAVRKTGEIGRNDPCWCGSGKKYKYCHMRSDQAKGAAAPAVPQAAVAAAPAGPVPAKVASGDGRTTSDGRAGQAPQGKAGGKGQAGKRKAGKRR